MEGARMLKHKLELTQSEDKKAAKDGTKNKMYCKFHPDAFMLEVKDSNDKKCSECDLIIANRIMNEDENSESEVQWRISCPGINCACHHPLDGKK